MTHDAHGLRAARPLQQRAGRAARAEPAPLGRGAAAVPAGPSCSRRRRPDCVVVGPDVGPGRPSRPGSSLVASARRAARRCSRWCCERSSPRDLGEAGRARPSGRASTPSSRWATGAGRCRRRAEPGGTPPPGPAAAVRAGRASRQPASPVQPPGPRPTGTPAAAQARPGRRGRAAPAAAVARPAGPSPAPARRPAPAPPRARRARPGGHRVLGQGRHRQHGAGHQRRRRAGRRRAPAGGVVDLDLELGDVAVALRPAAPAAALATSAAGRRAWTPSALRALLAVLPRPRRCWPPARRAGAATVAGRVVVRVLDLLAGHVDHVVVDTSSVAGRGHAGRARPLRRRAAADRRWTSPALRHLARTLAALLRSAAPPGPGVVGAQPRRLPRRGWTCARWSARPGPARPRRLPEQPRRARVGQPRACPWCCTTPGHPVSLAVRDLVARELLPREPRVVDLREPRGDRAAGPAPPARARQPADRARGQRLRTARQSAAACPTLTG